MGELHRENEAIANECLAVEVTFGHDSRGRGWELPKTNRELRRMTVGQYNPTNDLKIFSIRLDWPLGLT
jgi:hypothetical protein